MLSRSVLQQRKEEKGRRKKIQHTSNTDQRRTRKESPGEKEFTAEGLAADAGRSSRKNGNVLAHRIG
ncbi:unnamed protein product [Sphagnum jensenii]|uniref:Uncharacterized protein n=1 Tax=Sphagnum jensenii TaxID=128206 RepID=A0ABP1BEC9_9BRYO